MAALIAVTTQLEVQHRAKSEYHQHLDIEDYPSLRAIGIAVTTSVQHASNHSELEHKFPDNEGDWIPHGSDDQLFPRIAMAITTKQH